MNLLNTLFPEMSNNTDSKQIPKWIDFSSPWSILANDNHGLIEQIKLHLVGNHDVFIHPSAKIGDFVTIEGPSFVGPNVVIRHGAYIRKGSWICEGAVIGNSSEIKNSVMLPGAKAPHFNYVGDSIVGHGVNLGAGVKLSNIRNDRGPVPICLEDSTRIDSGMVKLGAMIGDNSQLGCNVVTNPGTIIMPKTSIKPNQSVLGWVN